MPDSISIKTLNVKEFFNSFSLLVVLGSISTSYFFARVFNSKPDFWFYHLLGTTVWAIYTADHILDGYRNDDASLSLRHKLHVRYKWILSGLVVLIAVSNIFISIEHLPRRVFVYGTGLLVFVMVYLVIVHLFFRKKKFVGKEIFIAFGVTGGMALLPAVYGNFEWNFSNSLLLVIFTSLNLVNLLIFAYFDRDHDLRSGFDSIVQLLGSAKVKKIVNLLLGLIFVLIGIWAFSVEHQVKLYISIVFLFMMHVLALIMLRENEFIQQERYRFWGDFIYLIPGLFWMLLVEHLI